MFPSMDLSKRIIEQARRNGGSITTGEAQALGASRQWLARRVEDGWLERIAPSTFFLPGADSEWRATLAAACHRLGAVVSHESAAQLHGLPGLRRGLLIVSVPVRRSNRFPGVEVRQKTDLSAVHLTEHDGLPVTTPARTIMDLAAHLGVKRLARLVDWCVATGQTSHEALLVTHSELGRKGKPGTKRMGIVLAERGGKPERPQTELEFRLLDLLERAGLPLPEREFNAPWLAPSNGRVDLAYRDHRLVMEGDSRRWHNTVDAFITDRERDNRAMLAGWRVLRYTWWDVAERPEYVVMQVREALGL
jgi:hypothetical protein